MKGLWTASDIEADAAGTSQSAEENRLVAILRILEEHEEGVSNAEIDALLNNNSQWVAIWQIRELLAAAFIEYKLQPFGEPGRYAITTSGHAFLQRLGDNEHRHQTG
jgi:repressor of nif and glnA expression